MKVKTIRIVTVAITTFIPWLISVAALGAASGLPRLAGMAIQYPLVVLLFCVAFSLYYKERTGVDPYTVTMIGMLCLIVYEMAYHVLFQGQQPSLTYFDWFVPAFLIASTMYGTGKFFTKE